MLPSLAPLSESSSSVRKCENPLNNQFAGPVACKQHSVAFAIASF